MIKSMWCSKEPIKMLCNLKQLGTLVSDTIIFKNRANLKNNLKNITDIYFKITKK